MLHETGWETCDGAIQSDHHIAYLMNSSLVLSVAPSTHNVSTVHSAHVTTVKAIPNTLLDTVSASATLILAPVWLLSHCSPSDPRVVASRGLSRTARAESAQLELTLAQTHSHITSTPALRHAFIRFTCRPSSGVLITGGTGGIGRAVALWMVCAGTKAIALASRAGHLPAELPQPAALVCDASRCDAAKAANTAAQPATILHAAGLADQGMALVSTTREMFEAIMTPKVRLSAHELTWCKHANAC